MPNLGVYIPDALNARLQRLREEGVDLNASNVARRALEAAVDAEERALSGDRLYRIRARLGSTKTAKELAAAEGEAAGRRWAEDVAALSELRAARDLLERLEREKLDVNAAHVGAGVSLELVQWLEDGVVDAYPHHLRLPDSVPHEFFERVNNPGDNKVYYTSSLTFGFLRGATEVLRLVEDATAKEEADKRKDELRQRLIRAAKAAQGKSGRRPQ